MYLDVIKNPVEKSQKKGQETEGICLWAYSSKHTEVLLADVIMWRLEELQRMFVSLMQRG